MRFESLCLAQYADTASALSRVDMVITGYDNLLNYLELNQLKRY